MFCPSCGNPVAEATAFCPRCGARTAPAPPVTATAPAVPPSPTATAGRRYAGFWLRFVAWVIDVLIVVALSWALVFALGLMLPVVGLVLAIPASLLMPWLYFALMESSPRQVTLGKQVLGLMVTDLAGQRISFARATGRFFAKILSGLILWIGYIMAAFTERKQALHDLIASCLVVAK